MDHWLLVIVMRYIHVVSAILLVGGTSFIVIAMRPSLRLLENGLGASVQKLAMDRFMRVVWIAIVGLFLSGAYNWILSADLYRQMGPIGNALIGIKVLVAAGLFALVWANHVGFVRLKQRAYLMINLHLAAIVILLAVILRYLRLSTLDSLVSGG